MNAMGLRYIACSLPTAASNVKGISMKKSDRTVDTLHQSLSGFTKSHCVALEQGPFDLSLLCRYSFQNTAACIADNPRSDEEEVLDFAFSMDSDTFFVSLLIQNVKRRLRYRLVKLAAPIALPLKHNYDRLEEFDTLLDEGSFNYDADYLSAIEKVTGWIRYQVMQSQ
jgi:hypothetical protein